MNAANTGDVAAAGVKGMHMLELDGFEAEKAAHTLVEHAAKLGASDIYIASDEAYIALHARVLGIVEPLGIVASELGRHMISHIKAMARLDLSEKRRPLDGRWVFAGEEEDIDLRISVIPTMYGEDIAIRLLARNSNLQSLETLGYTQEQLGHLNGMLEAPSGMILCTGPTGSGKTTSLYACLHRLNNGKRKINTIEDPIEYAITGVRHSEINPKIDLNFSDLLRAVLRQGPDVIMIGEIRDAETARVAVRAANSGHLVLATLHAPVAAAALQSMRAFDIHPHFLASALRGVISQRLVRRLNDKTKTSFDVSHAPHIFDEVRKWLKEGEGKTLYAARPDAEKGEPAYVGRTGIYEVMPVSHAIRKLIADGHPTHEINQKALEEGMIPLRQSALLKVALGETSTEEVFRVLPTEHMIVSES